MNFLKDCLRAWREGWARGTRPDYAKLAKERDGLREALRELQNELVDSIRVEISDAITMEKKIFPGLAEGLRRFMDERGARNMIVATLSSESGIQFHFTVRRADGKQLEQLYLEKCQECEKLLKRLVDDLPPVICRAPTAEELAEPDSEDT